jgi:hypothetical protein
MNTKSQIAKRIYELLIIFCTVVGLILILVSFVPNIGGVKEIVRGIGLSLFPAGVVASLLYRFAAGITEILLRERLETAVGNRLDEHMREIASKVTDGMTKIDEGVKRFAPVFVSCAKRGIENVHLTRGAALENFAWFLDAEVRKAQNGESARVWFVCSSMKGFLEVAGEYFTGVKMMEKIVQSGCNLRIMMTDPEMADYRAQQEGRAPGDIPSEIEMNLSRLKRIGIKRETIKFYPGTPTVFAIATMDRMLLNPYPYETEAFRCFSLIIYKTLDPDADIYHQYLRYHFEDPWKRAREIPPDVWEKLK